MSAKGQFALLELLDLTDAVKNLRAEISTTHYDITLIALRMGSGLFKPLLDVFERASHKDTFCANSADKQLNA